jgi:hypothetical protein
MAVIPAQFPVKSRLPTSSPLAAYTGTGTSKVTRLISAKKQSGSPFLRVSIFRISITNPQIAVQVVEIFENIAADIAADIFS